MKILLVHNRYQQKGGEDAVFETERSLLEQSGAEVDVHEVHNAQIKSLADRASAFLHVARNRDAAGAVLSRLEAGGKPFDLVHIHNFMPLLSPWLHRCLSDAGLPVVQTLHNYRLLCANGMLMRQNRICELCLGSRHHALLHRCYKGSLPGTFAMLRMQRASIGDPRWTGSVSRFIALTRFARDKFVTAGIPAEKIAVKGNSALDPGPFPADGERSGALFVGRIAPGKGVELLLQAWRLVPDIALTVVGDGPGLERARAIAPPGVSFAGPLPRAEVIAHMRRAAFLVMPSTWYEGFPMVLAETMACGLPVIASRLGGLAELVEHERTGLLFEPGDAADLARVVRRGFGSGQGRAAMAEHARSAYEQNFSPRANLGQLLDIYRAAIAFKTARGGA